jgi:NAD(P)-dependent dehydrogenase (short-subunit alcohol dehydrogenase family)
LKTIWFLYVWVASMLLQNKVLVVTGAGKGIGEACVSFFIEQGAKVVALTRSAEDVAKLSALFDRDQLIVMQGDVTSRRDLENLLQLALSDFGAVNGLVNNAGIRQRKSFLEISIEEWDKVIRNNLTSCFEAMQVFASHMLGNGGGSIVNVSSIVGPLGLEQLAGYGASKAGVIGLTKSVAVELAKNNIRINAVCPGFAATSYADSFKTSRPELYEFTLQRTPMGRWGTSREIAHTIGYLLSDYSSYVTGAVYSVDGGWMAC